MITKTVELYKFSELSESAKDKVRNEWREHDDFSAWRDEYRHTLKKFSELCDIKVRDWEVSDWRYDYRINYNYNYTIYEVYDKEYDCYERLTADELTGKLLFRYINSNIIPYLMKGRYHGKLIEGIDGKRIHIKRYSKVVIESEPEKGSCPLTGVCFDSDIIEPLMKYYRNWPKYPSDFTFADLMEECLDSFFKAWQEDIEWQMSEEAVDEEIENNWDYKLFLEDGTEF